MCISIVLRRIHGQTRSTNQQLQKISIMKLDNLPSRNDLESVLAMLDSLGWPAETYENHAMVRISSHTPAVELSAFSYKYCGIWIRPIYSYVSLESSIDLNTISSILLLHTFDELGSVSISDMDEETKCMTLSYRLLIPSEPAERANLAEAIMAASFCCTDLRKLLSDLNKKSSHKNS